MAAFSIVSYMKGILRRKGFTVTDYPFTEDEAQQAEGKRKLYQRIDIENEIRPGNPA